MLPAAPSAAAQGGRCAPEPGLLTADTTGQNDGPVDQGLLQRKEGKEVEENVPTLEELSEKAFLHWDPLGEE